MNGTYLILPWLFFLHLDAAEPRSSTVPYKLGLVREEAQVYTPSPVDKAKSLENKTMIVCQCFINITNTKRLEITCSLHGPVRCRKVSRSSARSCLKKHNSIYFIREDTPKLLSFHNNSNDLLNCPKIRSNFLKQRASFPYLTTTMPQTQTICSWQYKSSIYILFHLK